MPSAFAFKVMMAGETAWALAAGFELLLVDLGMKRLCIDVRVMGATFSILGLLAFVLHYTGNSRWLRPVSFGTICALPLVMILVAWTDPWHGRYWAGITNTLLHGYAIADRGYGAGFWVHFGYCYGLVAVSTLLLAAAVNRTTGVYRAQAAVMLFGVLLPWVVSIIDMTRVFGFIHMDLAAMTFALTGLAFLPGLFRFRLLELTPVAWAQVVARMIDPVVVIDPWGRVVEWNPAAHRLVGKAAAEVLGNETARVFDGWPALADRLDRIREEGESIFEVGGPDSLPAQTFDTRISRLGGGEGLAGWLLILRDITGLKQAERARERALWERAARAELESSNRAKDRFLATLSHELRTPLAPVLTTVTGMLEDPATPGSLRDLLEMIERNITLEARLIDDLLDLTRINGGNLALKREIIDAHELIRRVLEICREDFRSGGLRVDQDLAASRALVDVDPVRLQQVLWNLVKNAIKFTPRGGVVTVCSRNQEPGQAGKGDPALVVEIVDTGIGIDRDFLPRVFDVFEQGGIPSTRRYGGLGLGLTISRSIVEQHGGRLSADSNGLGLGATFTLELPIAAVAAVPIAIGSSPHATTPLASPDAAPLKILLVEDNHDTLRYLKGMLTQRGYVVTAAGTFSEALQASSVEEFDVLISDIELPDGSGLDLPAMIGRGLHFPAIALSGFGSPEDVALSLSRGYDIHLIKPVPFLRLEEAIRQFPADRRRSRLVRH